MDYHLNSKLLEGILIYIVSNLNMEMKVHNTVLQNIITGLEDSIDRNKLRYLLIELKNSSIPSENYLN